MQMENFRILGHDPYKRLSIKMELSKSYLELLKLSVKLRLKLTTVSVSSHSQMLECISENTLIATIH